MPSAAAAPSGPPPEPEGGVSQGDLDASIRAWDISENIIELGGGAEDEDDALITLQTDVLFRANSWELPSSAPAHIVELVEEIPEGATVSVVGHTDSRPTGEDFDNQELSENRAEAVAEVLRSERSDLDLEVSGAGDSEPAATEDPDDPATFAANRRVEISYGEN